MEKSAGSRALLCDEHDVLRKEGLSGDGWVEGETEGTEWIPESTAKFITYNVSEADRREPYVIEKYGEGNEAIPKDTEYETYYCVIAVQRTEHLL